MLPVEGRERAPIWPPRTATCLLQMLRPRPVPPLLRGLFISSEVPCNTRLQISQVAPAVVLLYVGHETLHGLLASSYPQSKLVSGQLRSSWFKLDIHIAEMSLGGFP